MSKLVHKMVKNGHKKLRFGSQGIQVSEIHIEVEGTVLLLNQQNQRSKYTWTGLNDSLRKQIFDLALNPSFKLGG
jgi:hypothetical protein